MLKNPHFSAFFDPLVAENALLRLAFVKELLSPYLEQDSGGIAVNPWARACRHTVTPAAVFP
jgi:hypothetical protein